MARNRLEHRSLMLRILKFTSDAGFTLMEVLVSMSLFSIAVLGIAVGATTVMRANQTSHFHTIAANLVQDQMEAMKAMTPANLSTCNNNCDNPVPTFNGVAFRRTWAVAADTPAPGLTQITVQVQWTDYADQTLNVITLVKQ